MVKGDPSLPSKLLLLLLFIVTVAIGIGPVIAVIVTVTADVRTKFINKDGKTCILTLPRN